jgi:predicted nucleotidyltransferase
MSRTQVVESAAIPGIPNSRVKQLEQLQAVWLFGSRAMGRHQPGSGIDLCLDGSALSQNDLLRLLAAVDDLLSSGPEAHPQMMGRRIWSAAPATNGLKSPCA